MNDGKPTCRLAVLALCLAAFPLSAQCPNGSPPPCAARPAAPAPTPTRSVAVLYFANRSADTLDAYLGDGITEEIIARLSMVSSIQVKSRTAVARFRNSTAPPDSLGRALGVNYLVSGTVQRSGARLRVSVELVRASNAVTAWAGRFDREDAELLDIETTIADNVAQEIAGRLAPRERGSLAARPTQSAEAYDRFVRGNFRLARRTPEDARQAIREFEAATQLDPRFAAAWARIALTYGVALDWGWPGFDVQASIRSGLAASGRALEMDSMLGDAWTARGYLLRFANARTYSGVREAFTRALALTPRDAEAYLQFGWALASMGDQAGALATLRRSLALDPERSITRFTLSWVLLDAGQAAEAAAILDTAIVTDPTVANLFGMRAWARLSLGDTAGARADANVPVEGDVRVSQSALAAVEAREGNLAAARAIADRLYVMTPATPSRLTWGATWVAVACAQAGQDDRVFDILDRIEPQGLPTWGMLSFPGFEPIRADARFVRLLQELAPMREPH